MSTSVSYKGNTIATFSNDTKTLTTAGKWVEGDITITDVSAGGSAVSIVDSVDTAGGTIRTITAVDLSNDTVAADKLLSGYTAHNHSGQAIVGTYVPSSTSASEDVTITEDTNSTGVTAIIDGTAAILGTKTITSNGTYAATSDNYDGFSSVTVNVSGSGSLQAKSNINPTTSSQTITADSGYIGLSSVQINAMPVGTAGTPTASKGAVSNHAISITPSVVNTTGYISGGTKTGTAVSVSASELVSGTYNVSASGTADVTNYASISVPAMTLPSAASSSSSGTLKATITPGASVQYINIPTGYNGTAQYYAISTAGGGGGGVSATQHVIHLEFEDQTDTDISVYYDDTLLGTMITAYKPMTYGGETVTLAQLDGVTWYEPANIPINTQLIDYTQCLSDSAIGYDGNVTTQQWYYASDYTDVAYGMTFTFKCGWWTVVAFYDSSKTFIRSFTVWDSGVATQDTQDSNLGNGTLTGSTIPSNAAYVRISSTGPNSNYMSLIRTS